MLNEIKSFLKTLAFFLLACFSLPVLVLTFLWVHYGNKLINYLLTVKYPTLILSKSKKIRTLIDTPRNAGIFNFLLCVKGTCDLQQIREKYVEELLEKRNKSGQLKFSKLRQTLITCWGNYAWKKDTSSFNINNHIIMNNRNYRGRPVSDSNIQDFVSDLVTKYIPANLPQWQVIIIPSYEGINEQNTEYLKADHYYMLVKVHHLIIAEEKDLHISELLQLVHSDPQHDPLEVGDFHQTPRWQHFSHFINKPEHIVKLWRSIKAYSIKQWNEFIYEFDSLDAHDGGCLATVTVNNLTKLLSLLLIISVNVCSAYWKWLQIRRVNKKKSSLLTQSSHLQMLIKLLQSELDKHHLSLPVAIAAIRATMHPVNLGHMVMKFLIMFMLLPIFVPIFCMREAIALLTVVFKTKKIFKHSYSEHVIHCAKLCICALWEFIEILYELFKAPVNIYEELFEKPTNESNILQMKSYSGRKIVCFSKSLDVGNIHRYAFDKNLEECDFIFACLARAISDYFAVYGDFAAVPEILNTTCRTFSKDYLTDQYSEKTDYIGGVVFLQLPLKKPIWEGAKEIHRNIQEIRKKQFIIYLASIGQTKFDLITVLLPQVLTKVFINYFAYNFPVTITDIHGTHANFRTYWNHKVEDVLLFRPPQSKTSLSLNLHRFGDRIRLAVMADTQLAPHHEKITQAFEHYLENIIIK